MAEEKEEEIYYKLYMVEPNETNLELAINELKTAISNCNNIIKDAKKIAITQTQRKQIYEMKIKEITKMNETNCILNVVKKSISHIHNVEQLTENELNKIIEGMNKTDYTTYTTCKRFIDLEMLVNKIIINKQKYPTFVLKEIVRQGQYDTLPPQTFYRITYVTEHNDIVDFGCTSVDLSH